MQFRCTYVGAMERAIVRFRSDGWNFDGSNERLSAARRWNINTMMPTLRGQVGTNQGNRTSLRLNPNNLPCTPFIKHKKRNGQLRKCNVKIMLS